MLMQRERERRAVLVLLRTFLLGATGLVSVSARWRLQPMWKPPRALPSSGGCWGCAADPWSVEQSPQLVLWWLRRFWDTALFLTAPH